jgi:hypothetical protein
MLIANAQVQKVYELHLHKVYNPQVRFTDPVSGPDKLTLSGRANEIQAIKSYVSTLSDTRSDMVGSLRTMVSKGTYQPSDQDTASAMIDGMSRAKLAS